LNRPSAHRASGAHPRSLSRILTATTFIFALALAWVLATASITSASPYASFSAAPMAQATATAASPGGVATVPIPLASGVVPNPVPSKGPSNPNATPKAAPGSNTGKPGATNPGTKTAATSNSVPWLAIIILAVVVLLGILGYFLFRSRRTASPALIGGGTAPAPRMPAMGGTTGTTAPMMTSGAAAASTATAAAFTPPLSLTCPNCGSTNDWNENFCHECGQDLRPVRAAVIAASGPPADVVTDDMPYLETLDRADEQLEYVLSRPRVVIGTTAGCDVMVDSSFKDSATVSPRHAQLLRNDDGSFTITDLGSPTGVSVNDVRIAAGTPVPISNGDTIKVGGVRFIYRVPLQGS
jgi:FHA domain